jgi:hypothetical protein
MTSGLAFDASEKIRCMRLTAFGLTIPVEAMRQAARALQAIGTWLDECAGLIEQSFNVPDRALQALEPVDLSHTTGAVNSEAKGSVAEEVPSADPSGSQEELVAEFAEAGAEKGAGAEVHVHEPWGGYALMNAPDIIDRFAVETDAVISAAILYEQAHRARSSVLAAAQRALTRR